MYAGVNSLDNTRGLGGQDGLPALVHLRVLSLPDNQIRRLDNLASCIALQVVDLSQNYIDDLQSLTQALPPCLRALNVSQNPVGSISGVRYMSELKHIMHLFVCGCDFAVAAADARVDLIPLFAALLPELITVDGVNVSSLHQAQSGILCNSLSLLHRMSNEQVIQFLSRVSSSSSSACATQASQLPFSDFVHDGDAEVGVANTFTAAETAEKLPKTSSTAVLAQDCTAQFPSAKSVHVLAHDITRLKHKLASFASPAPLSRSLGSPSPSLQEALVSKLPYAVSGSGHTITTTAPSSSQRVATGPLSPIIYHSAACVISRAWASFRARQLLKSRQRLGSAGNIDLSHVIARSSNSTMGAAAGRSGDALIIKRLELLEQTVAMQLHVIETLHAALERIVADATAAATLIQSVWRGHIDREVAHIIRERKRYHALAADTKDARSRTAAVAAAALIIAAFVRRKRAEDSAKWMLLAISSQCVYRLICNMGDRMQSLEQRLSLMDGSSQQPVVEISGAPAAASSLQLDAVSLPASTLSAT
jgi:hypothetical protein